MSAEARIAALEARVRKIEDVIDTVPENLVGEWLENTRDLAFRQLLVELEQHVSGFSASAFRSRFGIFTHEIIEAVMARMASARTRDAIALIQTVLHKRTDELMDDLFPPKPED